MDDVALQEWMVLELKRFGGVFAQEQVEVEVVVDKGDAQVDFVVKPDYMGAFKTTSFMDQLDKSIYGAVYTGRLEDMENITVVIRQDKSFSMQAIKEAEEKRKEARRRKIRRQ